MQDPKTGELHPLASLDDPARQGKEDWPVYQVGERVRFRGWWWEITAITPDGLTVSPRVKASKDDVAILEAELRKLTKHR